VICRELPGGKVIGRKPLADRRAAKVAVAAKRAVPTFGECADAYLASHETAWRNPKHRAQWGMTLGKYCASIRDTDPNRPNAARWKGWLDQMLPNPKKVGKRRGHHAAMPYDELPAFIARLAKTPGVAAKALAFTTLTAARSSEALNATWDEIDFDAAVWNVPGQRMKMQKPHAVPLSDPAVAILRDQESPARKPFE
jgi:integrase